MAKQNITTVWTKMTSKRGTLITFGCSVYMVASADQPSLDVVGITVKPQSNRSFYVTTDTDFIWVRSDSPCDVEVVNFI
ncbi:MAG: hypothetical protein ACRCXT_15815 [Paraclostridium sp.]